MQFTSLKAFLKPGTVLRSGGQEWLVEVVEWDWAGNPLKWWGKYKINNGPWGPVKFDVDVLSDDAYYGCQITKLGGAPIQLEDLI